ncbi:hypothetical protein WR25_21846 [Diploscapter pachys]|uniref:Ras-related protein Rab-21 n=1 Tax=Diploscapter pachys TaxID=2018661 RepID=A0A2A2LRH0_9BILA|nr:hypothetical protein WR25_21846 [Diploscapter pachys]
MDEGFRFKVILLGQGAVGKSSLLLRYVENKFSLRHISTIQASFQSKTIEVDGRQVELSIWDTAGQEKYHALGPIYYRGSQGALLLFDITDSRSFEKVKTWVKELQRVLGDSCALMIVGNKLDLEKERTVTEQEARSYAETVNAQYMETSAKENLGISQVFDRLAEEMIRMAEASPQQNTRTGNSNSANGRSNRTIELIDDEPKRSKCC